MRYQITLLRLFCCFGFVVIGVNLAGCNKATGTVTGKVSLKGTALKGGAIAFHGSDGTSVGGSIGEDGTYSIANIPTGTYKVCVDTDYLKPPQTAGFQGSGGGIKAKPKEVPKMKDFDPSFVAPEGYTPSNPAEGAIAKNAKRYTAIPDKYAKAETTDITCTVNSGNQNFDVDLKQ